MSDEPQDSDRREATALEYAERLATMSDAQVRNAYLTTDGDPGDPCIDALTAALNERNIDI